jgi:glycosyltransferase involved in cell wall biosynthesis
MRVYSICDALSKKYSLTLVSLCQNNEELTRRLPEGNPFSEVHRVLLSPLRSKLNALIALFTGESLQVAYYQSSAFARIVNRLSAQHDIVFCHLLRTAPYANEFKGPKVLELTDHLPMTYARSNNIAKLDGGLRQWAYRIEETRVDRAQNARAANFDLVTFVSDVDRSMFLASSNFPAEKVKTFGLGVALADRPMQLKRDGHTIAFIGNLRAMPNVDGATFFLEKMFPLLRTALPTVRLKIIGQCPDSTKSKLIKHGSVEFTGTVDSLSEATRDCVVGICPIRIGAGMQTKVLDYMALGLPVVTTSIGAEGLPHLKANEHLRVEDSIQAFVSAVVALLKDAHYRERLASASRQIIDVWYSREVQLGGLVKAIGEADDAS